MKIVDLARLCFSFFFMPEVCVKAHVRYAPVRSNVYSVTQTFDFEILICAACPWAFTVVFELYSHFFIRQKYIFNLAQHNSHIKIIAHFLKPRILTKIFFRAAQDTSRLTGRFCVKKT